MGAILLQETALQEIYELGLKRRPAEACGVLLPAPYKGSWILEIPNRSKQCHDRFEFEVGDLRLVLEHWFEAASVEDCENLAIFHTHPGGGVGPSRLDMQGRLGDARNLVVALTDDGPVPVWY